MDSRKCQVSLCPGRPSFIKTDFSVSKIITLKTDFYNYHSLYVQKIQFHKYRMFYTLTIYLTHFIFHYLCSVLLCIGESPRRARGSLIGMVNEKEFGVALLEANITENTADGSSTLEAHVDNIPPSVGE